MQNLIKKLLENSKKNKLEKEFIKFLEIFYSQNQERDFDSYSLNDLQNLAVNSYDFFCKKKSNSYKINFGKHDNFTIVNIVNIDRPFLVDSIVAMIEKNGFEIKNIIHPLYNVKRNKSGDLIEIDIEDKASVITESVIQIHFKALISANDADLLNMKISALLDNIALVVDDWKKIIENVSKIKSEISNYKNKSKTNEVVSFIDWICDGGFIFLGYQEFLYKKNNSKYQLSAIEKTSFGVFASENEEYKPRVANSSSEEIKDSIENPYIVEIVKSSYRSQIHKIANAERIRIQKFSKDGEPVGEYRLIGMFTSSAYYQAVSNIPLIRGKISNVIEKSGFVKRSHNYKDLVSVLEDYPRDELFQIDENDLLKISKGIVMICGRSKIKLFSRIDKFKRFVSCLVFMPKEQSNAELREKIRNHLAASYNGLVTDSFVQITESSLVRLHVIIKIDKNFINVNEVEIEREIIELSKPWNQMLKDSLDNVVFNKYKSAFSVSYQNRFSANEAVSDINIIEKNNKINFNLYKSSNAKTDSSVELKIYSEEKELYLSDMMPVLESFGLKVIHEHTYLVKFTNKESWIHYFMLELQSNKSFNIELKNNFEEAIKLTSESIFSVGSLNRLLISAELNWKQIYVLRAYAKYIYQAGYRHDQEYVSNILVKYSDVTRMIVSLFETKFDPEIKITKLKREEKILEIASKIQSSLNKVSDASCDVALRKFFGLVNATLRTNFYQYDKDQKFKGYLSFKLDCKKIPDLPLPIPFAEIFVFSNQMEAVHLRGGKVARGGLRWSDRHEDFRTEVLGLVKAQMTKNAVIVPVGSKGGFVVKADASKLSREEYMKEGIQCYKTFLRGLLDITDNVVDGKIIHPERTIMYDAADPYLVVAADKGTATFSDIANSISAEYNFWLGDAFASGGSVGYDHKKMGITAKGGWVSVKRHFAEIGIDTQSQDFTCIGIGDLAGDVFGNGMLLSSHIKLVAAFNHLHIFLDPNPDVKKSFKERQRMFNLPRSSWDDYDKSLISAGGGIFLRSSKVIKISKQMKEVLKIEESELTPNQLITFILKAPVDLLWNGGIGTYVKSGDESNQEVGDKANDELRVNGSELRCKVVGEGGNLGFTQKGRIEYALNGGRINTDAMDNSAGVDCSDHEVNIKIALTQAMKSGKLNISQRNKILESMTDQVAHLVLEDNRLQTQAITVAQSQGFSVIGNYAQFINNLEKSGLLNRKIEFLPSSKEIAKRQIDKIGMTRPELCVMLAYAKMEIYQELLSSKLVDDEYFSDDLVSYFPEIMQKKFHYEIANHQLRREIIATQITNFVVNRVGIVFVNQIFKESGFKISEIVKCLIIAVETFGIKKLYSEIEILGNEVSYKIKAQMFIAINKLLERSVLWLLRTGCDSGDISKYVDRYSKIASELNSFLFNVIAGDSKDSFQKKSDIYRLSNVPAQIANKIAALDPIASTFDISEIALKSKFELKVIAKLYYEVGTRFSLKWLRTILVDLPNDDYWQKLSSKTIIEDLYSYQTLLSKRIVEDNCQKKTCDIDAVLNWCDKAGFLMTRYDNFIQELRLNNNPDTSMFVVALNRLKPLLS